MKKILLILSALTTMAIAASAQIIAERSENVTLFPTYRPARILLTSGKVNFIRDCNIFMKNSTLIYKSNGKVMEANMNVVKTMEIDGRKFINLHNQLAELIDTVEQNKLVSVKTIDVETMQHEFMNTSDFTNIDVGDMLSYSRTDGDTQSGYPVLETYYFILNGKQILCQERNVKAAVGKKKQDVYDNITRQFFSWSDREDLMRLLTALTTH